MNCSHTILRSKNKNAIMGEKIGQLRRKAADMKRAFEKLFPADKLSKLERVEATLNRQPVDRVALHDELSYNAGVLSLFTGKRIRRFDYTVADIGLAIRRS